MARSVIKVLYPERPVVLGLILADGPARPSPGTFRLGWAGLRWGPG